MKRKSTGEYPKNWDDGMKKTKRKRKKKYSYKQMNEFLEKLKRGDPVGVDGMEKGFEMLNQIVTEIRSRLPKEALERKATE